MGDIATLLREEGWDLPTYNIGEYETTCPYCSHLRKANHRKNKCAKVWIEDTDFATYSCLNCGKHGFVRAEVKNNNREKLYTEITLPEKREILPVQAWLESRGISMPTAQKAGVYAEKNGPSVDFICYPFFKGGKVVNIKRRNIKEKMFYQEKNPEPVVYNYDNAFTAMSRYNDTLLVTEGEMDTLVLMEAGYDNCVSLPAGSDPQVRDKDYRGSRFAFLKASRPLFESAKHIILMLDADEPGQAMTKSLINMLPHEKLLTVDWSVYNVPGKDANDFWLQDKSIIDDAIKNAKPVEVSRITPLIDNPKELEEYMLDGVQGGIYTGYRELDKIVTFLPGDFVAITGYAGCLSGDSVIRINRERHGKAISIMNLYNRFNGFDKRYRWTDGETRIRRFVGDKIVLSKIQAVMYSGRKQVYELVLADGKKLKATPEHRIMTDKGFVELQKLTPGDLVMVDNLLTKPGEHKKRAYNGIPEYSKVVSVTPLGIENTYDIQCEDIPDNEPNFNANGIIVHNSGKSTWVMSVLLNMARTDNLKILYCAFENPKKQVAAKLLQMLIGEPTFGTSEDILERCKPLYPFLNEHFRVLDDTSEVLQLDNLLNNIKNSIVNDGVNVVVIDPFNKIEYARTKDTTGDIGAVLNKLISFTHRHNVLMFLVAHPTKPENRKIGGQEIPTGYDISGSANFQNMSDAVISVHRKQDADGQKSNNVRITVTKWRFGERGREGSAYLKYNARSATYFPSTQGDFDAECGTRTQKILK